ncbi:MAG: sigma-70 family RNA polymerase sigma factor [Crocinitomicaceae bacterium]|nr:sigma-70 family RNA polymerase sigma factor [Crocinitomicaceae bacterium]NDA97901.1 sigma-70 family RNA polymerase sigma factor [Flavobacteriia bacterium]NDC28068.1 sigma-70 family RNA polymerase sigma factor [Crocinitomicaceae bacterium]NDC92338.1 sigma-70 family RNA polymerase sigma factor [Flavobacteriales bacterium]
MNQKLDKIISACLANKQSAQKELYELFSPKMYGICLRYAVDRDEAADLLQEGFIKVFEKLESFKNEGSFEGWIRRIIVNTALENYRKKNKMYLFNIDKLDIVDEIEGDETDFFSGIEISYVLQLIQDLAPGYRMVLNLYALEGYSHKKIADHLGISVGTSKSQLARARVILVEKVNSLKVKESI